MLFGASYPNEHKPVYQRSFRSLCATHRSTSLGNLSSDSLCKAYPVLHPLVVPIWGRDPSEHHISWYQSNTTRRMLDPEDIVETITSRIEQWKYSFVADFSKEIKEAFMDVLKNQPKSSTKRPSVSKVTHYELLEIGETKSEDENAWQPRWDIYPEDCPEEKQPDLQQRQDYSDLRTNPFHWEGMM